MIITNNFFNFKFLDFKYKFLFYIFANSHFPRHLKYNIKI